MSEPAFRCVPSHMGWAAFSDHLLGLGLATRTVIYYVRRAQSADGWLQEQGSDLRRVTGALMAAYASTLPNSHSSRGQLASALGHYWDWTERVNPPLKAIRVPSQPLMLCRGVGTGAGVEVEDDRLRLVAGRDLSPLRPLPGVEAGGDR